MTTVIFVRHGQSDANAKHYFAGQLNAPLTELGHKQAQNAAVFLKDFNIDVLYASDLDRAYNTAVPISKIKGLEIIKNKNLREIDAGEWEGATYEYLEEHFRDDYKCWREDIGNAYLQGGESVKQMSKRFTAEVMKLIEKHAGQTIGIVTHGTPIRVFECFAKGLPVTAAKDIPWVSNASVSMYEYNGSFKQILRGEDGFQQEFVTKLPSNV